MSHKFRFLQIGLAQAILAGFVGFTGSGALGADADFAILPASQLKVFTPDECRAELVDVKFDQTLQQLILSVISAIQHGQTSTEWRPTGEPYHLEPNGCDSPDLEKVYIANRTDTKKQADGLRQFFNLCDVGLRNLHDDLLTGPLALAHAGNIRYQYCDHPNIRKVAFRLASGEIVRGALALKNGNDPRPLVIAKCGMMCNTGDSGMSQLLMHLFDESPFNVLVLANSTGADYVRDNGIFIPGGFKEGQQIVQIAQLLRGSFLNSRISSLHLVGMSLGAHATLFASYLSTMNPSVGINSALATCPAVDLQAAVGDTFSFGLKGMAIGSLYDAAIDKALVSKPELAPYFTWNSQPLTQRADSLADIAAYQLKYGNFGPALAPFDQVKIRTGADYWKANDFAAYAQTPLVPATLAIAASDDEVVDPNKNLGKLAGSSIATALTPVGDHCVWSEFYTWRISSALFRGFVLSQSPEMLTRQKLNRIDLDPALLAGANNVGDGRRGVHRQTIFKFAPGVNGLVVTYKLATECGAFEAPPVGEWNCLRDFKFLLKFSHFTEPIGTNAQTPPWWAHAPVNQAEADSLTRWANINLKFISQKGYLIEGTRTEPTALVWLGYDEES